MPESIPKRPKPKEKKIHRWLAISQNFKSDIYFHDFYNLNKKIKRMVYINSILELVVKL